MAKDIVYFSLLDWHGLHQRPHHLAKGLARRHRVFFIEPPYYSIAAHAKHAIRGTTQRGISGVEQVSDSLVVLTPPPLLPRAFYWPGIAHRNFRLYAPTLRRALTRWHVSDPLLWLTFPSDHYWANLIPHCRVLYDCMDDHRAFFPGSAGARLEREEQALLAQADVVFASSPVLESRLRAHHETVHLIRNAVPVEHFCDAKPRPVEHDGRFIVGYSGSIDERVDLDLLLTLIDALPDVTLLLIGPARVDLAELAYRPNVIITGPQHYADLPGWIKAFDVGLIPFRRTARTAAVNPVKVYEYLAAGVPVVSTDAVDLDEVRGSVFVADDAGAFIEAVRRVLYDGLRGVPMPLDALSWGRRIEEIERFLSR